MLIKKKFGVSFSLIGLDGFFGKIEKKKKKKNKKKKKLIKKMWKRKGRGWVRDKCKQECYNKREMEDFAFHHWLHLRQFSSSILVEPTQLQ